MKNPNWTWCMIIFIYCLNTTYISSFQKVLIFDYSPQNVRLMKRVKLTRLYLVSVAMKEKCFWINLQHHDARVNIDLKCPRGRKQQHGRISTEYETQILEDPYEEKEEKEINILECFLKNEGSFFVFCFFFNLKIISSLDKNCQSCTKNSSIPHLSIFHSVCGVPFLLL